MSTQGGDIGTMVVRTSYAAHEPAAVCVSRADRFIHISDALLSLDQDLLPSLVEYGEGIFVVHAHRGAIRYRLLEANLGGYWLAERFDRSPICADLDDQEEL